MDMTQKLHPGQSFVPVTFKQLDGPDYTFGAPGIWQALFVFRGPHCPICKRHLTALEGKREAFAAIGVVIAGHHRVFIALLARSAQRFGQQER